MEHWIIGPQLTGFIFVIAGLIMSRYPPKQINDFYGYRTSSSRKNQETWDEANQYSATYMVKAGFITFVTGIVITAFLATTQIPGHLYAAISIISMLASAIVPAIFVIVAKEKHLTKTFGDK
ncbi:MAG: SdpI family protein [Bacteroidota bacterium]